MLCLAPPKVVSHRSRVSLALRTLAAGVWGFVRAVSGDAAYDIYLRRAPRHPMSRQAFYLDALERRYSRIDRCC
jgi:Selenoprotein, putative